MDGVGEVWARVDEEGIAARCHTVYAAHARTHARMHARTHIHTRKFALCDSDLQHNTESAPHPARCPLRQSTRLAAVQAPSSWRLLAPCALAGPARSGRCGGAGRCA
eukprot:364826-Chlamydomonas_euryale.AAC.5